MRIHRGPAAVIGDESHTNAIRGMGVLLRRRHYLMRGEGVASRMIRKPENLPVIVALQRGSFDVGVPRSVIGFDAAAASLSQHP